MPIFNAPVSGLWTSPNPFSQVPQGSLARASNVRFKAPGVLGPRPGFPAMAESAYTPDTNLRGDVIAFYDGNIVVRCTDGKVLLKTDAATPFMDLGSSVFLPSVNRLRFVGAARDLYWNSSAGVYMWDGAFVDFLAYSGRPGLIPWAVGDAITGATSGATAFIGHGSSIAGSAGFVLLVGLTGSFINGEVVTSGGIPANVVSQYRTAEAVLAGNAQGLSISEPTGHTGTGAWMNDNTAVAYRYTICSVDRWGRVTEGPPSGRRIYRNTSGSTQYLDLDLAFGDEASVFNFLRLYRSDMSNTAPQAPSDELWQVYETDFLTSAQVAAGFINITDTTPESILEVPLHTNANSGDGAGQADYRPPIARSMTYFASRMWYFNTRGKQSIELSLIGVDAPSGLQDSDTLTLSNEIYTAKTTPSAATDFELITSGSAPENIAATAQNLVEVINSESAFFNAFYVSAENGFPGRILIQERSIGGDAFRAYSSRATCWSPQLPALEVPGGGGEVSDNNAHPAGLFYSKPGQPEAVPPENFMSVEADNDEGLCCFPLNYRLILFKTSGIYFCNDAFPFSIQKISKAKLIAPDSVAGLGDKLYALTDLGFVAISDSGVEPISPPIDDVLRALSATALEQVGTLSFGVGYETARQYICFLPESEDDEVATQAYVYSSESQGFTHYALGAASAGVDPTTDRLVVAAADANYLLIENKTSTDDDYADRTYSVTITDVDGDVLALASVEGVTEGDVIIDDDDIAWLITDVDSGTSTITTIGAGDFSVGDYSARQGIAVDVAFNKITGGQPATMKVFQQASILFRHNSMSKVDVSFETEVSPVEAQVELSNPTWGEATWGDVPWGDLGPQIRRVEPLPVADSNACQLSVSLRTRQALASFELLGAVLVSQKDTEANRG